MAQTRMTWQSTTNRLWFKKVTRGFYDRDHNEGVGHDEQPVGLHLICCCFRHNFSRVDLFGCTLERNRVKSADVGLIVWMRFLLHYFHFSDGYRFQAWKQTRPVYCMLEWTYLHFPALHLNKDDVYMKWLSTTQWFMGDWKLHDRTDEALFVTLRFDRSCVCCCVQTVDVSLMWFPVVCLNAVT